LKEDKDKNDKQEEKEKIPMIGPFILSVSTDVEFELT